MLSNSIIIAIFISIGLLIGIAILLAPLLIKKTVTDKHKLSEYECGIEPEGSTRSIFDIRFFLIAVIFVIFDVEVVLLLPLATSLHLINIYGFLTAMLFVFIITAGLIYEFSKGISKIQ